LCGARLLPHIRIQGLKAQSLSTPIYLGVQSLPSRTCTPRTKGPWLAVRTDPAYVRAQTRQKSPTERTSCIRTSTGSPNRNLAVSTSQTSLWSRIDSDRPRRSLIPRGIAAPVFPTWFVCELVETVSSGGKVVRRRRLIRWQDLDTKGRRRFVFDDGRKSEVTPIRFVCACESGHLQDIEWRWAVHGAMTCQEPMWVEEKGTSADPADTSTVCGCGRRLSLQDTFQVGRLGKCRGERPWLLDRDPNGCGLNLKLLTRTATNTYFPQVYTVISLPTEEDELKSAIRLAASSRTVE
jgi:hypothetical protein